MSHIAFIILAIITVLTALAVISQKNVIHSAIALILLFFSTSGIFLLLKAELVAVLQIFLYAGAIIVIYLFVIMMINLREGTDDEIGKWRRISLIGAGSLLLAEMLYFLSRAAFSGMKGNYSEEVIASSGGSVKVIARMLYTKYLYPFEIISLILLVAMVGAIVLAKKVEDK